MVMYVQGVVELRSSDQEGLSLVCERQTDRQPHGDCEGSQTDICQRIFWLQQQHEDSAYDQSS